MKLALSGRIIERDRQQQASWEDIKAFAQTAVQLGYHGVDLRASQLSLETQPAVAQACRSLFQDLGLEVVRMMPDRQTAAGGDVSQMRRFLDLAASLGCQSIRVGGDATVWRHWAQAAVAYGIRIGVQNHIGRPEAPGPTETIARTLRLLREVYHPQAGLFYDPAHLFVSQDDRTGDKALPAFQPYLIFVQFQALVETSQRTDAGVFTFRERCYRDGGLPDDPRGPPFSRIVKILKQMEYDRYLCVFARRPRKMKYASLAACWMTALRQWQSA